jgi:hypothetical protein
VWRVLARVPDTGLHPPTATATPTKTPTGAYPADRALTTDELGRVLAVPAPAVNTALVASVTIDPAPDACPMNSRPTYGVVHGITPQVCVIGTIGEAPGSVAAGQNDFAFRYLGPGVLELLELVQPASAARLAHVVADDWSQAGKAFLVEGWLGHGVIEPGASHSCDPAAADNCAAPGWLSDLQSPSANQVKYVVDDEMKQVDSILSQPARFGVYLVTPNSAACPSPAPSGASYCGWRVLARITNLLQASASLSPIPAPTATPTVAPPATPLIPSGGSPVGLIGPGNRPLTAAELSALIAADPEHLADRYVIDERVTCDGTNCSGVAPKALADVIQPDGSIGLVGPVDLRPDGGLLWTVPQTLTAYPDRFIFIVDAWMFSDGQRAWLDSDATAELTAQNGAFGQFAPPGIAATTSFHGLFLVQRVDTGKTCGPSPTAPTGSCYPQVQILARLEVAVP